jgi:hypothetical protein
MNLQEIKAELSVKSIEFEQAMKAGLPHAELIEIYRNIKQLQYQLIMEQVKEPPVVHTDTIS